MRKNQLQPLPLALACLLAAPAYAAPTAAPADAAAGASVTIPLDIIRQDNGKGQFSYRIGINIGVNGAPPEEYIFDTGASTFNIAVGSGGKGQPWFPLQPGVPVVPSDPAIYVFGNGTYGNLGATTTVASIDFYNSATKQAVVGYDTPQGLPVLLNTGNVGTQESLDGNQAGAQVGYFLPAYGRPYTFAEIAAQHLNTQGQVPVYLDATWQQQVDQGVGPEDGGQWGLFGNFGAGPFGKDSVLGNLTASGYVIAANGQTGSPSSCSGCAHVILNLSPAVRAQFINVMPWNGGADGTFPLSGAPIQANQFNLNFFYSLDGGKHVAEVATMFDSGSPTIFINDAGMLALENAAGNVDKDGNVVPGLTLGAVGEGPGLKATSIVTGDPNAGDQSNVVMLGPNNGMTQPGEALYGIAFFFHNSMMFDLANQATGYTPFFVSVDPISTAGGGYAITSTMAPQGIAGVISGNGSLTVGPGALAQLSNVNTYTGPTSVGNNGLLALAGPGSIAQSSNVQVDGLLDVSRASQTTILQSLSGSGTGVVGLGNTTLELAQASGTFSGAITDGGIADNQGGRLVISGGTETLAGKNTFTGPTGIGEHGALNLTGSLAGGVANMGTLMLDGGRIGATVLNAGRLLGNGRIDGDLAASGIVAPGTGPGTYQALAVGGNYLQQAGAEYLVQLDPASDASSLLAIGGTATLQDGAKIGLSAAQPGIYQIGTRYTVLDAAGGLTGTWTLGGASAISAVLGITPSYDADHGYLSVVQERPLTDIEGTPNQTATLAGVQSLPADSQALSAVASLPTDAAIQVAADELSGEIHATMRTALIDSSRYVRDATLARVRQAGDGDATGGAATQGIGVFTWWGQFVGAWGHLDGNDNSASARQATNGLLLGTDRELGAHSRVGVVAGYTHTTVNIRDRASSMASSNFDLGVYGGTEIGAFGLRGGAAYTWHQLSGDRNIDVPGLEGHALGNYHAHTAQVFGEAGYRFAFMQSSIEPFLRASWVRLDSNDFQEYGDDAALAGAGGNQSVTFTTLGARAATRFEPALGGTVTVHGTLGWKHAFNDRATSATLAFDQGDAFTVDGLPIARDAAVVGVGTTLHVAKNASFDLDYQGQASKHAVDNSVRVRFDWRF